MNEIEEMLMKTIYMKVLQTHAILLPLLIISGCQREGNLKSMVNLDSTSVVNKNDDSKVQDQTANTNGCTTSKGVSLPNCDTKFNLTCTGNASGEFCSQIVGSSEARVWGPY